MKAAPLKEPWADEKEPGSITFNDKLRVEALGCEVSRFATWGGERAVRVQPHFSENQLEHDRPIIEAFAKLGFNVVDVTWFPAETGSPDCLRHFIPGKYNNARGFNKFVTYQRTGEGRAP